MFRTVLLALAGLLSLAAVPALAQCDLTPGFNNFVTVTEGDLDVTFATEAATYFMDETVTFEIIVRNTGTEAAVISWPVGIPDAVMVTPVDCVEVQACLDDWVFSHPDFFYYIPDELTLDPGACEKWTTTWDLAAEPAPAGLYKAWGGLFAWTTDPNANPVGDWILPSSGAILFLDLQETVSATRSTWSGVKVLYR